MASRPGGLRAAWLAGLLHVPLAALALHGVLRGGVLFQRDLSSQFYPDYAFVARSLRQGVWPLWNPTIHAGTPWILAYPPDLVLLLLGGPGLALGLGVVLHLALAMAGASWLARETGRAPLPAFLAGAVYGLSGSVLSLVNLLPLFEGAAWLPWVVAALLRVLRSRDGRLVAALAGLLALQLSTLAAETVFQAALAALLLAPLGNVGRGLGRAAAAAALALLLAAPAVAGTAALLAGTARAAGFVGGQGFAFSATPAVLAESLVPRFFGNVHSFAGATYWGQPFFPDGYPYLLSLYLGGSVLVLCACGREPRLIAMAAAGALLSLGNHGPLGLLLEPWAAHFRAPVKFFLLTTLAAALLAARGLERALASRRGWWTLLPGALLLLAAALARWHPGGLHAWLAALLPELLVPSGRVVVTSLWPSALLASGALACATGAALAAGPRVAPLAALALAADLLVVNAPINRTAPPAFYDLRDEVRPLVQQVAAAAPARVFSYGVAYAGSLPWAPWVAASDQDAWLYYLDRQSLLPRTHVIDGLEGAYEPDRTGWAPAGSSLDLAEMTSTALPRIAARLARANVRFLFSFESLPADHVEERGRATLPELRAPLRLYELKDAQPRAFFLPALAAEWSPPRPGDPQAARVVYRRRDAHSVILEARTPPGFIAVLDGYSEGWRARLDGTPVPLQRFSDRYWALATPGGEKILTVSFEPGWRFPALGCTLLGLAGLGFCFRFGRGQRRGERSDSLDSFSHGALASRGKY